MTPAIPFILSIIATIRHHPIGQSIDKGNIRQFRPKSLLIDPISHKCYIIATTLLSYFIKKALYLASYSPIFYLIPSWLLNNLFYTIQSERDIDQLDCSLAEDKHKMRVGNFGDTILNSAYLFSFFLAFIYVMVYPMFFQVF